MGSDGDTRIVPAPRPMPFTYPDEAAWKAARGGQVGASDVSTLLRIPVVAEEKKAAARGDYGWAERRIVELLARKLGEAPEIEQTLGMRMGLFLEPFLLGEYLRVRPERGAILAPPYTVHAHPTGVLAATPDAWTWDLAAPDVRWPLQLKAYSGFTKGWFAAGCPEHLAAQVLAEALCTDAPRGSWFALVGNADVFHGDIDRDPATEEAILAVCESFCARIRAGREGA